MTVIYNGVPNTRKINGRPLTNDIEITVADLGALPLLGSAASAKSLTTPRYINGAAFNGTLDITTPKWGTPRRFTVGSSSHIVDGSSDVTWNLSEIGVLSTSGGVLHGKLTSQSSGDSFSIDVPTGSAGYLSGFTNSVASWSVGKASATTSDVYLSNIAENTELRLTSTGAHFNKPVFVNGIELGASGGGGGSIDLSDLMTLSGSQTVVGNKIWQNTNYFNSFSYFNSNTTFNSTTIFRNAITIGEPTLATHATTKKYVDDLVSNIAPGGPGGVSSGSENTFTAKQTFTIPVVEYGNVFQNKAAQGFVLEQPFNSSKAGMIRQIENADGQGLSYAEIWYSGTVHHYLGDLNNGLAIPGSKFSYNLQSGKVVSGAQDLNVSSSFAPTFASPMQKITINQSVPTSTAYIRKVNPSATNYTDSSISFCESLTSGKLSYSYSLGNATGAEVPSGISFDLKLGIIDAKDFKVNGVSIVGSGGSSGVSSVNGATGAVVLTAADIGAVGTTGNQSIGGTKTFSGSVIVPTPSAAGEAATKDYVDTAVAGAGGGGGSGSGANPSASNSWTATQYYDFAAKTNLALYSEEGVQVYRPTSVTANNPILLRSVVGVRGQANKRFVEFIQGDRWYIGSMTDNNYLMTPGTFNVDASRSEVTCNRIISEYVATNNAATPAQTIGSSTSTLTNPFYTRRLYSCLSGTTSSFYLHEKVQGNTLGYSWSYGNAPTVPVEETIKLDVQNGIIDAKGFTVNGQPIGSGGGGGSVSSVNGSTGAVVLDAGDVGALPATETSTGHYEVNYPVTFGDGANFYNVVVDFNQVPTCSADPTDDEHLTRKSYVDSVVTTLMGEISALRAEVAMLRRLNE